MYLTALPDFSIIFKQWPLIYHGCDVQQKKFQLLNFTEAKHSEFLLWYWPKISWTSNQRNLFFLFYVRWVEPTFYEPGISGICCKWLSLRSGMICNSKTGICQKISLQFLSGIRIFVTCMVKVLEILCNLGIQWQYMCIYHQHSEFDFITGSKVYTDLCFLCSMLKVKGTSRLALIYKWNLLNTV